MVIYQGIVSDIKNKDRAEVLIYPIPEGIPNAPTYVNETLCHVPSGGSIIRIEAINSHVNAKIGDFVMIKYEPPGIIKNILLLICIPGLAGILGFILKGLSIAVISFFLGLGIGIFLYKITSNKKFIPIIVNIIKGKDELTKSMCQSGKKEGLSCQYCPLTSR